jgi:hypothetical protein
MNALERGAGPLGITSGSCGSAVSVRFPFSSRRDNGWCFGHYGPKLTFPTESPRAEMASHRRLRTTFVSGENGISQEHWEVSQV